MVLLLHVKIPYGGSVLTPTKLQHSLRHTFFACNMLLTISTNHRPATDLGFLLHKHPDRCQTFDLSFGMVVKPLDYMTRGKKGLVRPAVNRFDWDPFLGNSVCFSLCTHSIGWTHNVRPWYPGSARDRWAWTPWCRREA
jgi:hypothetical protein